MAQREHRIFSINSPRDLCIVDSLDAGEIVHALFEAQLDDRVGRRAEWHKGDQGRGLDDREICHQWD